MPDKDGKLSQAEVQGIIAWLTERAKNPSCESCGTSRWTIADILANAPVYLPDVIRVGGATVPFVVLICDHCGNIRLYSAVQLGIVPSEEAVKASIQREKEAGNAS